MVQVTPRAALHNRWPLPNQRRIDSPMPTAPWGWDSPSSTSMAYASHASLTPHSRLGRLGLGYVGGGLGDAAKTSQEIGVFGTAGVGVATGVMAMLTTGGATLPILGVTAAAVPVIGAALMAAVIGIQFLVANSGCGQTCIVTSQWANQAAEALQKTMDAYFALPAPRTQAQQAVALAAFDSIWHQLQQACGQPGTGDAGKRCTSDRQEGACVWHQAYDPTYPGQPAKGECWNWFSGYRRPIAQDPVVSDASLVANSGSASGSLLGGGSLDSKNLMLILGVGLLALGVMGN